MGTLFEQPVRSRKYYIEQDQLDDIVEAVNYLIEKYGLSFDEAIQIIQEERKQSIAEMRKLDKDIKDEQLAGFGEIARDFVDYLSLIAKENSYE